MKIEKVAGCGHSYAVFTTSGRPRKKCPDCEAASEARKPSLSWWVRDGYEARWLAKFKEDAP